MTIKRVRNFYYINYVNIERYTESLYNGLFIKMELSFVNSNRNSDFLVIDEFISRKEKLFAENVENVESCHTEMVSL